MLRVTCAIIIYNQKILVTQRGEYSDHPFQWEFPGGKVANLESLENAVKREILEELALEIIILREMIPVKYDYGFKQIELFPYLCSIKSDEIKLSEHHDFKWVTLEQMQKLNFSAADRQLIEIKANLSILKKYSGKNMNDAG